MERVTGRDHDDPDRSAVDLRVELGKRDLARHLALFYRSTGAQLSAVAAYLGHGLGTGHRCLYLIDDNTRGRVEGALRAAGVAVEERVAAGDLVIRDAAEVYLDAGFDPERMIETLDGECRASVDAGYEGLWLAGENTWCFNTEMSFDPILDFEADFDAACPELPVTALCQYDLTQFGAESAAKALWTHEQIIYRNTVCDNPFYVPPGEYRAIDDPYLNVRLMLEQAYTLTRARREVDRREQRLAVVNRVLRHNIRNDLNVVDGVLRLLGEADLDEETEARRVAALDHVGDVLDLSEKARHVQRTISDPTVERVALCPVIERAVADVEAAHPDAEIEVAGDRELAVLADTNLDVAIGEALTNAIVHQEGDAPAVSLTVSTPAPDTARIDVANPGSIPDTELRTIERGHETELEHASGLGLWLVAWIVENAHGTVQFPESGDDEATLRMELYRVPD